MLALYPAKIHCYYTWNNTTMQEKHLKKDSH